MTKKQRGPKTKRIPQRICIACHQPGGKRDLIRLIRTENGVEVDLTGKKPGRGAYLDPIQACWQKALKTKRIDQALRTQVSVENQRELSEFIETLPE
ncbi:YlxR family protein [Chloroflexi bacterium TSY]|nr:YlxR family protein [Chloroflexi bacterium TSY]